ncbi:Glycolipid transfer protein 2 [Linum perenne]
MKRKREMDHNKVSEIKSAIEELSAMSITMNPPVVVDADDDHDHDADGHNCSDGHPAAVIPTMPFVHVCSLVIEVLDKIGPTMAVLRQDITQNIQRLEGQYEADPSVYSNLVEILKKEASEGISRKRDSCSKAFVWLTSFSCKSTDHWISQLACCKSYPKIQTRTWSKPWESLTASA